MVRTAAILLAFFAVALVPVSPAMAETISLSTSGVGAQLDYSSDPSTGAKRIDKLRIDRLGVNAYNAAIAACGTSCYLGVEPSDPLALWIGDLDADGEREVVVDVSTGGAQCCRIAAVYSFEPSSGTYRESSVEFGYSQYRIFDIDQNGRSELHSGDTRFYGRFVRDRYSVMPIQVQQFEHGSIVDVTTQFRSVLRQDMTRLQDAIASGSRGELRGYYTALTAEKCRLSGVSSARRMLEKAARAGRLKRKTRFGKGGEAFVKSLFRYFDSIDYC